MGERGVGEEKVFYCRCKAVVKDHHLSIACDICDKWFHVQCVGMSKEESESLTGEFMCKTCSAEGFMLDGAHVESASSAPLRLPDSSSSEDDASSDEDEESMVGTTWGRVVYDNGSSFWGELRDGHEYIGAFVEAGPKGKAKMVKWEERNGEPVMLKILWEDIDYQIAQDARKKAQAATRGDTDDGNDSFMYDVDAAAGDGTNAEEYEGGDDDDQDTDADDTDEDEDLQLELDAPVGGKSSKSSNRKSRDIAQPGSKRSTTSSTHASGPAFKKRRKEKELAKTKAKARAAAALRKSGGSAESQKLRTRVIGKFGEALEVNKSITAKALAPASRATVTKAAQTEPVKADTPDAQERADDETVTIGETHGDKDDKAGSNQHFEAKKQSSKASGAGIDILGKETIVDDSAENESDRATVCNPDGSRSATSPSSVGSKEPASSGDIVKQDKAGAMQVSEDKYEVGISSKLLAGRATEIEKALYEMCEKQVSMKYKQGARDLAHNLADPKNDTLRIAVLKGEIVGATLVRMTASELANPDAQEIAQRIEQNKLYHSRKVDEAIKDGRAGLELPSEYNRAGRRIGGGAAEQAESEDLDEATSTVKRATPKRAFSLTARLKRPGPAGRTGLGGSTRKSPKNTDDVNHLPNPKPAGKSGPKYVPAPAWKPPPATERAAAASAASAAAPGKPPPPPAGWDDVKYSKKRKRWYYRRRNKKPDTRWVTDEEMSSGHAYADPDQATTKMVSDVPAAVAATSASSSTSGEVGWTAMYSTNKRKWYIVNLLNTKQRRWVGASEAEARDEAKQAEDARLEDEQRARGQPAGVVDLTSDVAAGAAATDSVYVPPGSGMCSGNSGVEISTWLQQLAPDGHNATGQYNHAQSQYGHQQWAHGQTAAGITMYGGDHQPLSQYGQQQQQQQQQQQPYYHQTQQQRTQQPYHPQQWQHTSYQQH